MILRQNFDIRIVVGQDELLATYKLIRKEGKHLTGLFPIVRRFWKKR